MVNKFKWLGVGLLGIIILLTLVFAFLRKDRGIEGKDKDNNFSGKVSDIYSKNLNDKFGFLGGGVDDTGEAIVESGAGWARPHPGGFLWDSMQAGPGKEISFKITDEEVKNLQKNNLDILATIWGFADWDQKNLANSADCKVSTSDEFLPKNDKKGRGFYLPEYRCNPSDWQAHNAWVEKIVERYDGDGIGDMAGLKKPIRYWEVMNEPDLNYGANSSKDMGERLNFYKKGPLDYGELLKNSYTAIKKADPDAQVLIAGATGGDEQFLSFYKTLFMNMSDALNYFDIGNIHCISNDQTTNDFNVSSYKKMLETAGISKPIWVTEAEAMYGKDAEENFASTKVSTAGAIDAGAQKIFYTRYSFDDFRTDMSQKTNAGAYPSVEKYNEIFRQYDKDQSSIPPNSHTPNSHTSEVWEFGGGLMFYPNLQARRACKFGFYDGLANLGSI